MRRALPDRIVLDNGAEFQSRSLDAWAHWRGGRRDFIKPGKPVENAFIESFNSRLRGECMNSYCFSRSLTQGAQ